MKIAACSNRRQIVAVLAVGALVTLTQCSADKARSGSDGSSGSHADRTAANNETAPQQTAVEVPATAATAAAKKDTAPATGKPLAVAAADFGTFLKTDEGVVLVDFWADWCQPCHLIAPEIDKVAAKYAGRVQVVKVDLTEDPGAGFSAKYGIDFLPTVMIFKDGKSQGNLVVNGRPMPDAVGIGAALDKQL